MSDEKNTAIIKPPMEAMSVAGVTNQVALIQSVMKSVMQKDVHYGVIPGCGNKPTLFKPGAEKLLLTFRLRADYSVESKVETDTFIMYTIKCALYHINTGLAWGSGIGACNSKERKYKSNDPWDIQNTILKMGEKRSLTAAILNATAASDIFTQDIEDMPNSESGSPTPTPKTSKPHCLKCNTDEHVIQGKEEYGGGWLCYKKKGGCGYKWADEPEEEKDIPAGISKDNLILELSVIQGGMEIKMFKEFVVEAGIKKEKLKDCTVPELRKLYDLITD